VQLIRIGLEHPDIRHEIFYGASDNARGWWDNSAAFRLGYRPQYRAEEHSTEALAGRREAARRSGRRVVPGRTLLQRRIR
jgi:uronate dehydrogenase